MNLYDFTKTGDERLHNNIETGDDFVFEVVGSLDDSEKKVGQLFPGTDDALSVSSEILQVSRSADAALVYVRFFPQLLSSNTKHYLLKSDEVKLRFQNKSLVLGCEIYEYLH
jgi:hypothetical protein